MLFLTNILLTILVGFKIKEYLENKIPLKTKDDYADKEWVVAEIKKLETAVVFEAQNLDAHKVFTSKSFSELRNDLDKALKPAVEHNINLLKGQSKWKELFNLASKKRKPNKTKGVRSLKYTKFELEKEVLRYLKKRGEAKGMGLKAVKHIKNLESKTYKRQISKAYSRLWARQSYQLKK